MTAPLTRRRKPKLVVATEHQEQSLLFQWANVSLRQWPELGMLFAIPNSGGYKGGFATNVALVMKAKRGGVKKGVPDVMLPVPRKGYHGCFIEMKRTKDGTLSAEQLAWLAALKELGYKAVCCRGWEEARDVLTDYLAA